MSAEHDLIARFAREGFEQESARLEELRTREFVGTITPDEVLELERIYRNRGIDAGAAATSQEGQR